MRHAVPFVKRTPLGVIVGRAVEALAKDELLARLHPEEAALASSWGEARVRTFTFGRLVLRDALAAAGASSPAGAILRDVRGAPILLRDDAAAGGAFVRASLSHKDDVAVAIAALGQDGHIGVDVEGLPGPKDDIAPHVLTSAEVAELAPLEAHERRRQLALRFSLKESFYKAIDPVVRRYVGFHEVEVRPHAGDGGGGGDDDGGGASFTIALKGGEGPFDVDALWFTLYDTGSDEADAKVGRNLGRAVVTVVSAKLVR